MNTKDEGQTGALPAPMTIYVTRYYRRKRRVYEAQALPTDGGAIVVCDGKVGPTLTYEDYSMSLEEAQGIVQGKIAALLRQTKVEASNLETELQRLQAAPPKVESWPPK